MMKREENWRHKKLIGVKHIKKVWSCICCTVFPIYILVAVLQIFFSVVLHLKMVKVEGTDGKNCNGEVPLKMFLHNSVICKETNTTIVQKACRQNQLFALIFYFNYIKS